MSKICILDAKTLGGDTDLSIFSEFGELSIYQTSRPEEVIDRIKDQDIVISNKVVLNEANLRYAPEVKLICVAATGTNNIDLDYAKSKNVVVCNVAGYSTYSVVQHTFAMLFYLLESLSYYDHYVKSKQYASSDIFTHLDRPFGELRGKTWGIIGLGSIGSSVAEIARAFGCRVIYYSTSGRNDNNNFSRAELSDLLQDSDIVSIHAPLNSNTHNMLAYEQLQLMKKQAILLNLGRGGIVNETDLARALDEGLIAGAALDVLEKEPIDNNNPLINIKNPNRLLITPHIAWASIEARNRLIREIALNIEAFLNGSVRNQVNP